MFKLICAILVMVCFGLAAFKVPAAVDWTPLGFLFVTAAVFIPL